MSGQPDAFLIPPEWIPDHARMLATALRDEIDEGADTAAAWQAAAKFACVLLLEQINERTRDVHVERGRVDGFVPQSESQH